MVPESGSPSPNDVDQGSSPETALPYELDPVLTDPQSDAPQGGPGATPGGGSADESDDSGPIEAEPVDDPDAGLQLTDPAGPGGLDSGALPVSPTAPAPPTATPVAPDDRDATAEGAPPVAKREDAQRARWRVTGKQPRVPREHLTAKPRARAEAPAGAAGPVATHTATETPAVATEPVAAAVSLAAPLGRGRFHVVRPGESLWSIASRLLGPGASDGAVALAVRQLWRLNAARIGTGDPNLVRLGVKLRLR